MIHNNSVDIVRVITTFFHTLTNTGSSVLDILLLMMDNRCFRSLMNNPLLKTACKTWTSNADTMGDEVISVTRHRGYYTGFPKQVSNKSSSSSKPRACSQRDLVHFIWREAISIFSSLLRAARCQTFGKVDEPIAHQLTPVTTTVLDFICAYEDDLFSCFKSMLNEARAQSIRSSKGRAKSSFSSSIQSASLIQELTMFITHSWLLIQVCQRLSNCSGVKRLIYIIIMFKVAKKNFLLF